VFEWPIFAGYGVFMWWKLTHDRGGEDVPGLDAVGTVPDGAGPTPEVGRAAPVESGGTTRDDGAPDGPGADDDGDEDLASYNRYLAALNASGRRKHW
jgi:hypothetical protein